MLNIFKYYILSVLMGVTIIQAQPTYFNEIYNLSDTWSAGLSITASEDGFMACGISGAASGLYGIVLLKLNNEGVPVDTIYFSAGQAHLYPGSNGSFKKHDSTGYFLYGSKDPAGVSDYGLFIRFDSEGDTLFSKTYLPTNSTMLIGRSSLLSSDKGYLLTGDEFIYGDENSNVSIIKVDSLGTELWRENFGTSEWDFGYSVVQTTDLGYVVGGKSLTPGIEESDDPIIYKTDSLGNLEWSLNLGGPYKDDKAMVCNTQDSCIMVLTAYADSMYTPEFAYTRINLIKIDLNGDTIWNKKYGPSKPVNFVSNIIALENGDFIACGYAKYSTYLDPAGWIFKFSPDGDSIWYRDYYYYPSSPVYGHNYLYDLSLAGDNGIVSIGQAHTFQPPDNTQKMWVLKVDSIGCEFPNCWVGLEEHGGAGAREHGDIAIYPNPASDEVTIALGNDKVGGMEEVRIYNSMGILLKKHLLDNQPEFRMDVSGLPAGVYFIRVKGSNNASCVRKLVIGR